MNLVHWVENFARLSFSRATLVNIYSRSIVLFVDILIILSHSTVLVLILSTFANFNKLNYFQSLLTKTSAEQKMKSDFDQT